MGVEELSSGYTPADDAVAARRTPRLMLVDRGAGLAWAARVAAARILGTGAAGAGAAPASHVGRRAFGAGGARPALARGAAYLAARGLRVELRQPRRGLGHATSAARRRGDAARAAAADPQTRRRPGPTDPAASLALGRDFISPAPPHLGLQRGPPTAAAAARSPPVRACAGFGR